MLTASLAPSLAEIATLFIADLIFFVAISNPLAVFSINFPPQHKN